METRMKRMLSLSLALLMVFSMMPNVAISVNAEDDVQPHEHAFAENGKCSCGVLNPDHKHSYTSVVTAPTCVAAGFTTNTCVCGDTNTSDEVAATGHTYGENDKCVCGVLNPEHVHSYTAVVTAPTCEAAGFTTNTCICGDTNTSDEVAATGHTYGEDDKCACGALNPAHEHSYTSVVTAPTCDAAGYTTNTCACGDVTTTDEVAATGHTYGENGKCACGALDPAHEHTYVEGKCVCGDERILMMSPAPSTEPTVKPCEEGCWMEEGHEGECEVVCAKDKRCVLENGHEGACEAFGGVTLINTEESLAAAIAVGGEVALTEDVILSNTVNVPAGKTVVLDLAGHSISMENSIITTTYAINNNGTLTLKDSVGGGSVNSRGIYNGYNAGGESNPAAKLIVESGTYNAKGTDGGAAIFNYGIVEVKGGSFTSVGGYSLNSREGSAMTVASGVTANNGIYITNGTLTVNGGEISGNRSGCHVIYGWNSTIIINGGTFYNYNSGNATIMAAGTTVATINDGTFGIKDGRVPGNSNTWTSCLLDTGSSATMYVKGGTINGGFRVQGGTMEISGGSFNDCYGSSYNIYTNSNVSVKGGTYTDAAAKDFAEDYLANNHEIVAVGENIKVQRRMVDVTVPSDTSNLVKPDAASGSTTIPEAAITQIVADIQSSEVIKEVTNPNTDQPVKLEITLKGVELAVAGDNHQTTSITYDVTPKDDEGNIVTDFTKDITFKLPIPGNVPAYVKKAIITHKGTSFETDVLTVGDERYVEISSDKFSEFDIQVVDIDEDNHKVAIGTKGYTTLDAAVNAVKNNETITLIKDCDENVTLNEKVGLYYTIDGNEKTMTGTITINPLSDENDNRRITIKNINFVDTKETSTNFIYCVVTNHYPRITVDSCDFTGSVHDKEADKDVAISLKTAYGAVITNCTGAGLHSFLQNTAGKNLTIDGVTVTNSKSAFSLGTVQGVTVKNCNITAGLGYGIRLDAGYNNNAVIENCQISAFIPVVVRKASVESHITIAGTNTLSETNTDGFKIAIGTSEYEKNGTLPTATTGRVIIKVDDAALAGTLTEESYQSIIAGAVQKCGNKYLTIAADAMIGAKYYDKLSEAVAAGGNVVVLKDIVLDAPIEIGTNVTLTAEEPVTITATGDAFTIKENASLSIGRNITIDASMTASGENAVLSITEGTVASAKSEKGGKINVTGGTVDKAIAGQNGIVTISGGNIEAVELLAGAADTSAITGGNIGTVTAADVVKFVSGGIFENEVAQEYLKYGMECVRSADKFIVKKKVVFAAAYTTNRGIYGEAEHIVAFDSFTMDLYDADGNLIATSELVDKADGSSELLDGYVELITWNILLPGNTDSWWNTQWADTHPRADVQPAKVVLKADGVKVGEANVQMNAPDNLNPVKWPELDGVNVALVIDGEGNPTGYDTVIGAIHAAIDAKAPEVQLLVSTEEKMVTDEELLLKADLTLTAKEAVTAKFYNSGTSFDFIFNSESGEHTLTIGKNVNFTLADRVIWAGYYGNNVNVVVDGTLAGSQYWHGADTTINATGTLKATGEALVMRRGATMTVNGGKVDANYFNILSGNIEAKDAVINTGAFWIANTGGYAGEGSVYINLDNSSLIGTGNLSVDATSSALIELENGSVMTVALHDGVASKIGDTGMIWVDNSTLNMQTATLNGAIDVYNGGLLNLAGKLTNNGTVTVFADSMIEATTIDGNGNVVINTTEMTNTEPVAVMKLSGEYDETKITVVGNAAKKITEGDKDVVSVYFDVFVDADGDKAVDVGEGYGTLEAAVAAAKAGQTIYILRDADLNNQVVVDKNITITALDNVKVAANSTDAIVVASGATLTLGKNVEFASEICANGGAVVVDGAEVTAAHAEKGGTITVNSGAVETASATDGNSALNVTGGSVTSASSEYGAQINVSGGTVGSVIANKMGFANISAGKITDVKASGEGAVITITGGEISGSVVAENGGKILIIGGWFASDPTKDDVELAKGMMWDPETKYIRHKDYVAFIDDNDNGIVDDGETGFREIEEAVAAENETVKLLNNLTDAVTIEKSVTIDLNGYKTAEVTVKSGNAAIIDSSDNAGYGIEGEISVEKGAGLELREVKVGAVNTSGKLTIGEGAEVESIVANTGADVSITDGTINDGISVLGGAVTIKGGRINGEIAIEEDADEDASIDIFSGIFGNPVPAEYCADGYIPVDYKDGTYGVELSVVRHIDLSKTADGKIKAGDEIYIDGDAYSVGEDMTVEIPNALAKKSVMVLTTYTYNNAGQAGAYPTAMYVWLVKGDKNVDGDDIYDTFKTERVSALDNFFKYEGTSIRVGNAKNGIRFFTSVHAGNANKLMQGKLITSGNLAGVKMVSAGTEFWKTADNKLRSEVYGGKVGNTFRVFQSKSGRNWFTGVLTGLDTDAATIKETISTRPYAQLMLADGTVVTLYGGTLGRSILYVATQNQNTFKTGTASDNFIEGLIAKGSK